MLLIFQPKCNARSTIKLLQAKPASAVTIFFTASGSKSEEAILTAEGAFSFHTVKHLSGYKTADCTSVLFKTIIIIIIIIITATEF